jgi:hypothetical protein
MTNYEVAFWKLQNNWHESVKHYEERIEKLEAALRSIAANACCDSCREAALVARKALEGKDD